ncbi:MAG: AsmA family protein [Alcaligenaceae bacterium]|nr:AsmA family protein [Alcaligenaceae bacterium]
MNIWLKRVLFTLVAAVIAALVGLAIFLLTFNPNAYKDKLEQYVYTHYERTLTIDGDIGLSLFPRIGLSVQNVALSDRGGKDTFISIDSARFAVAIWPLLTNRLVVDHIAVSGFKAWVTRDEDGRFNFSDLLDLAAPPPVPPVGSVSSLSLLPGGVAHAATVYAQSRTDAQIDIAGLELKDGQIHFLDERAGASVTLTQLAVTTGRMTYDQAFDVTLKGRLVGVTPNADAPIEAQALVRLDPNNQTYSAQKINVQVSGRVADLDKAAITLRGNLAYSGTARTFAANGLDLAIQGDWIGPDPVSDLKVSLLAPQVSLDQRGSELKVEKLALRAAGKMAGRSAEIAFDAPALSVSPKAATGEPVTGTIKVTGDSTAALSLELSGMSGNADELKFDSLKLDGGVSNGLRMLHVQLASPSVWSISLRKGELSAIKGDISLEDAALPGGRFAFPMIGSMHLDLIQDLLNLDINAVINGGQLELKTEVKRLADPQVTFSLNANKLDLNNWIAPVHPVSTTDQQASGEKPEAQPEAKPKAKVGGEAAKSDEAAKPEPPTRLDMAWLDAVDITGSVKVDDLRMRDIQLRDLTAQIRAAEGKLDISKIAANLYDGRATGALTAKSDQSMTVQLNMDKVAVEPFMQALIADGHLSGTGTLRSSFEARGDTVDALIASLSGKASLKILKGAIRGFDANRTIREASAAMGSVLKGDFSGISSPYDMSRRTPFSTLEGRIEFKKGIGTLQKVALVTDLLRVTEGSPAQVDLPGRRLDILVNAQISKRPPRDLADTVGVLRGVTVPVLVSGPFDALAYSVQWKSIPDQIIKDAVKAGLSEALSGRTVIEQLLPDAPAPSSDTPKPQADPVQRIGDALKGLLGQ